MTSDDAANSAKISPHPRLVGRSSDQGFGVSLPPAIGKTGSHSHEAQRRVHVDKSATPCGSHQPWGGCPRHCEAVGRKQSHRIQSRLPFSHLDTPPHIGRQCHRVRSVSKYSGTLTWPRQSFMGRLHTAVSGGTITGIWDHDSRCLYDT